MVIVVFLSGCSARISRAVPRSAAPGSVIELKGLWFGDEPGEAEVLFGETTASITLWSRNSISVKVPDGTGTTEIFIRNQDSVSKGTKFTFLEPEYELLSETKVKESITVLEAEGASVTVPPGAASPGSTLEISGVKNAPSVDESLYLDSNVYDISIERQTRFNDLLMLEFDIEKGMDESSYITAAYWDVNIQEWVQAPSYFDQAEGKVRVYTDHLTNWRLLALKKIYDIHETDHFIIAYNAKDKTDLAGRTSSKAAADMALKIGTALDDAYDGYRTEIGSANSPSYIVTEIALTSTSLNPSSWFQDSKETIDTRPLVKMSSSYNKYGAEYSWSTGQLVIPTKYADEKDLRTTAAHELFHAFQNYRLTVLQMSDARWLMEATAEYASYYVGNSYTIDRIHTYAKMDKNLEFFENRGGAHEYGMASYINFLTGRGASFGAMWNAIVSGRSDAAGAFDSYVVSATGESNNTNYRKFWQNVLTNSKMPAFGITDIGVRARSVPAGKTLDADLNVRNDQAMAALLTNPSKYNSNGTRTLIIEPDGNIPSTALVEAFMVNGFDKKAFTHDRTDGGTGSIGVLGPLYPFIAVDFTESKNQAVYITAYSSKSGTIGIKVSDVSLKLTPESLEDAQPYKAYKFTAAAKNIPTTIKDIKVTWELDDGTFLQSDEIANKRGSITGKLTHEFEEGSLQDILVTFEDAASGRKITSGRINVSDVQVINISYEPNSPKTGEKIELESDGKSEWYFKWDTGSTTSGKGMTKTSVTYDEAGRHYITVKAYSDQAMTKSVGYGTTVIEVMEEEVSQEPEPTEQPVQPGVERVRWLEFEKNEYLPGEYMNFEIKTNSTYASTYESLNYYKWSAKPADDATMKAYKEATGKDTLYTDKSGSPSNYSPEVPGTYEVTGIFIQDPTVTVSGTFKVGNGASGYWRRTAYVWREDEQYDTTTTSSDDSRIKTRTIAETTKLSYMVTMTTSYPDGTSKVKKYTMTWSDLPETLIPGEIIRLSYSSVYEGEEGGMSTKSGLAVYYNERGSEAGIKSDLSYAGWDSGVETVEVLFEVPAYGSQGNATRKLDLISGTGLSTKDGEMFVPENYIYRIFASYEYEEGDSD